MPPSLPSECGWRTHAGPVVLLAGLCAFLFLYGLNAGELYRNEGLRALLGAEMLRGGSWVVPTLYGEPLLTKPPGMYVAIALASWPVGGVSAATARLPSALAAAAAVLLTYAVFARRLGPAAGLVAAASLPASVLWLGRVPSAEIDMVQLAWVAASLFSFLRALELAEEGASGWRQWPWWQGALLAAAGGLLTKWTAPAFLYLTAVPLLAWRRRLGVLVGWPHLASAALAAGLCLAWVAAAAGQAGWDVFLDAVRREALPRLSPGHHPRPYPWHELLTFPLGFLLAGLPGAAPALWALRPGFARLWDTDTRRLLQMLHCWAWANLLFWTLAPGHRPRHLLPAQPALAGLAALVWVAWLTGKLPWPWPRVRPGRILAAGLALWLAVKLAHVHAVVPRRAADRAPQAKGARLAALVPAGQPLYLFRLKDEGLLFYFGRPACRLTGPWQLPGPGARPHCLLTEEEWRQWPSGRPARVLGRLRDEQGALLVLVRAD